MLSVLSWFGSFLSGPILKSLVQGYTEKLKAQNNSEKISADLQQAQDALSSQVVIAEESKWFPFVRWGFAFPFMAFNAKVIIWDRMLHLGATDALSPDLVLTGQVIIGAYFGHSAITNVAQFLKKRA